MYFGNPLLLQLIGALPTIVWELELAGASHVNPAPVSVAE
jgi:hypothetical protein